MVDKSINICYSIIPILFIKEFVMRNNLKSNKIKLVTRVMLLVLLMTNALGLTGCLGGAVNRGILFNSLMQNY